jgi:hypothetical protein
MLAVLPYRVPGQQTSPGPDPRIATWQGRTRIAGVRAMRYDRMILRASRGGSLM